MDLILLVVLIGCHGKVSDSQFYDTATICGRTHSPRIQLSTDFCGQDSPACGRGAQACPTSDMSSLELGSPRYQRYSKAYKESTPFPKDLDALLCTNLFLVNLL